MEMPEEQTTKSSLHADKYNDPRVSITRRGILIAIAIGIFAIAGAAMSIIGRRTKLEKTSKFWGDTTIIALQLGERLELRPRGNERFDPMDLSGTAGLGHLRRLLLDERNYDWNSVSEQPTMDDCGEPVPRKPRCIQIRLTDPTANRFELIQIDVDLKTGLVGPSDGSKRVKLIERKRSKLAKYFETVVTIEELRAKAKINSSAQ